MMLQLLAAMMASYPRSASYSSLELPSKRKRYEYPAYDKMNPETNRRMRILTAIDRKVEDVY
jgi:hypothetical protein